MPASLPARLPACLTYLPTCLLSYFPTFPLSYLPGWVNFINMCADDIIYTGGWKKT